jgi:hypothetical protein
VPNPLQTGLALAKADAANQATVNGHAPTQTTWFPTDPSLDHVHIQVGWDGSPSDADNREDASIRFTVWTPRGQVNLGIDEAEGIRARLLNVSGAFQRIDRGAGRIHDVDPDTDLPFCFFSLSVVLTALTP